MATSTIPAIGDGTFEALTVNTQVGSGSVRIQRYGKIRFLFVDFRPSGTGVGKLITTLDSSDSPSESIQFATDAYNVTNGNDMSLGTDGKLTANIYADPNNELHGTTAYMVP